jgi:hypothetical protein
MLAIKSVGDYMSKKGNPTFVYAVTGEKAELAAYAKAQGVNHRVVGKDDPRGLAEGTVLFFTTRYVGETGKLVITSNGNVVADMSDFRKADSLSKQFGGNLGEAIAAQAALSLLGKGNAGNIDSL